MKKLTLMIAGLGMLASAVPAAAIAAPARGPVYSAPQQWQNINARQANLDRRIDQGVRNGSLNRREASRLRAEFRTIAQLEARYRSSRPGLTMAERRDLDRRFDTLAAKIRMESRDRNHASYRR